MGLSRKWLKLICKKFRRSSRRNILIRSDSNHGPLEEALIADRVGDDLLDQQAVLLDERISSMLMPLLRRFTEEELAAIKIQSYFRGHLVCLTLIMSASSSI